MKTEIPIWDEAARQQAEIEDVADDQSESQDDAEPPKRTRKTRKERRTVPYQGDWPYGPFVTDGFDLAPELNHCGVVTNPIQFPLYFRGVEVEVHLAKLDGQFYSASYFMAPGSVWGHLSPVMRYEDNGFPTAVSAAKDELDRLIERLVDDSKKTHRSVPANWNLPREMYDRLLQQVREVFAEVDAEIDMFPELSVQTVKIGEQLSLF